MAPAREQPTGKALEIQQALGLAMGHHEAGRLSEAEAIYRDVLKAEPIHPVAKNLLGIIAYQNGNKEEARTLITEALAVAPDYPEAHLNLGRVLEGLGEPEEAVASFEAALAIKPKYADAHNNLGNVFLELGKLDETVASYRRALAVKPDFAEAHNNLGNAFRELGRLKEAIASYQKALALKPDFSLAWRGLMLAIKALRFLEAQGNLKNYSYNDGLSHAARATAGLAMLEYYLDGFKPHESDESFHKAMAALPPKIDEEVPINGIDHEPANPPQLPDKMVALLQFGRSGTGLLHSLIDGHPEVSTLPSIYLRGFFNADVWSKISSDGWRGLPERFADKFAILFDANSPQSTPGRLVEDSSFLGRKEGMANVGESRDESLSLDRDKFCSGALRLLKRFRKVDPGLFLLVVHAAFEKIMETKTKKHTVFYHIHNPDDFAKLNFLRYFPDAKLIVMVREPIQCCESWLCSGVENNYKGIVSRIISMLFGIDQVAFRKQESVGIRLEDLKSRPESTLSSLCAWLGIKDSPSLYQMTAQGKKWWGDPSSPDFDANKAMAPFGKSSINRATGAIFSEKDQFILRTLFYPFSVRFGYREPDPVGFEKDLKEIRPMFDDMLDFEKVLSERSRIDPVQFKRSGSYLLLRAGFLDRWDVLNEFKDYPHMLMPLNGI